MSAAELFRAHVQAMAKARPNMRVATAVDLALALSASIMPPLDDWQALGSWSMQQPEVVEEVARDRKINAIKELRGLTGATLKQAKDAIESIPSGEWGTR